MLLSVPLFLLCQYLRATKSIRWAKFKRVTAATQHAVRCSGVLKGGEGLVDTYSSQCERQIDAPASEFQKVLRIEQVDVLRADQHRSVDHPGRWRTPMRPLISIDDQRSFSRHQR